MGSSAFFSIDAHFFCFPDTFASAFVEEIPVLAVSITETTQYDLNEAHLLYSSIDICLCMHQLKFKCKPKQLINEACCYSNEHAAAAHATKKNASYMACSPHHCISISTHRAGIMHVS